MLLEIETDKAQMEVEAQDDGIMAKIIARHKLGKKETNADFDPATRRYEGCASRRKDSRSSGTRR